MAPSKDLWERYCRYFRFYPTAGISLDISRMKFPDELISPRNEAMNRAFADMAELERGAIANPDENRMVGHYWLREPSLAPTAEIQNAIRAAVTQVLTFVKRIQKGEIRPKRGSHFTGAMLLGIGGSALGPQLVADCLGSDSERSFPIAFFDNTDPDGIARHLQQIGDRISSTLVMVISKSGGTVETHNCALEIAAAYRKAGLSFSKHAVAITCPGSKLDRQAAEEGWVERFPLWDWVGGRTSLFSTVGLLPAALGGIDIEEMLSGARIMDELTRSPDLSNNPAALLALVWHAAAKGKGEKDMVVLPYKDRLLLLSRYLQQLVMESLGKEKDLAGKLVNQGIAVYGNKGSTDQHAYVQQLREGVSNFFVNFVQVLEDYCNGSRPIAEVDVRPDVRSGDYLNGFLFGTREALYENGRESFTITLDQLNAKSLSALIALYERAVGFYASLVNINAYHQPGVEAGKKAAEKVMEIHTRAISVLRENKGRDLSVAEVAKISGLENEQETIYRVLEHLSANPSRRITRGESRLPAEARYRAIG